MRTRVWYALCQYHGLTPFRFSHAVTAAAHSEADARPAMAAALASVYPTIPEILEMLPGALTHATKSEEA